jgi:phosphoribosylanthranilate isomerase
MSKIKICGLTRTEDTEAVNAALPDYIGFVFAPSRRRVSFGQATGMKERLDGRIKAVGVFVNEEVYVIADLYRRGVIDIAQLHGGESSQYIERLKKCCDCPVIKAVSVQKPGDAQVRTCAEYLLLDHKGGGTGETFDWGLIGETEKPYFLAGGLNSSNIAKAVSTLAPYCIDVSSGAETEGLKDAEKIAEIVRLVRDTGRIK